MHFRFPLLLLAVCILSLVRCTKDSDDDDDAINAVSELTVTLEWQQRDADLDLDLDDAPTQAYLGMTYTGDILEGPGTERLVWLDDAPDGTYRIEIEWFAGAGDVPYTLTVATNGESRAFTGTLEAADDLVYYTFTKEGADLDF